MKSYGSQSMIAPLKRVLVIPPVEVPSETTWQDFGYFKPADAALATQEHEAFIALLQELGAEVIIEENSNPDLQDAIFTYDPSIMTNEGAILCNMGKVLRQPEVALHQAIYEGLNIPVLGAITGEGRFEGGDCLWLDEQTLIVGRGFRTNDTGIQQLKALLPKDVTVLDVDLPYYHGVNECLHLMSLVNLLDTNLAAVYLPLLPVKLYQLLIERNYKLIDMPTEEFDSQGMNILTVKPNVCLMVAGNDKSIEAVRAAGCVVHAFQGEEISKNRTGGPTCLTRPIWRIKL